MKVTLIGLLGIVMLLSLGWGIRYYRLEQTKFFAPREAEVQREVFENTPSFIHGKAQHIARLKMQYERAESEAQRNSLKGLILHEAAAIDWSLLPTNLQTFLESL